MEYAKKSLSLQDSIDRIIQTEAIAKIQALYDFQRYEEENNRLKAASKQHQLWIFILVLSILLIVALGTIYYNWLQWKRKKILRLARTSLLMNELVYSRSSIYTHEEIEWIKKMEKEGRKIMDEKDYLQKQLYEAEKELSIYGNKDNAQIKDEKELRVLSLRKSIIYRFFREWNVETCGNITQDKWDELRVAVDTVYPRFTDRLLLLYPKLSEQELRICYLIKIGIGVKTIALMLNKSISAITNARTRMNKKLRGVDGKAEQFDQFIADL